MGIKKRSTSFYTRRKPGNEVGKRGEKKTEVKITDVSSLNASLSAHRGD
jgi:hypothetical protein